MLPLSICEMVLRCCCSTFAIDVKSSFSCGSNAEDEYFVLGDDRANSEDSRHEDVGNVKRRYIYGKAWFIRTGDNIGFVKG